jgi:hypothetical protein
MNDKYLIISEGAKAAFEKALYELTHDPAEEWMRSMVPQCMPAPNPRAYRDMDSSHLLLASHWD